MGGSSPTCTATQDVFPPYLTYSGPEHGQEPRTPWNVTRSGLPLPVPPHVCLETTLPPCETGR